SPRTHATSRAGYIMARRCGTLSVIGPTETMPRQGRLKLPESLNVSRSRSRAPHRVDFESACLVTWRPCCFPDSLRDAATSFQSSARGSRSHQGHAAVGVKLDAIDEAARTRGQEERRLSELLGKPNPTGGDERLHRFQQGRLLVADQPELVQDLRLHGARAEHIHADSAPLELQCPIARE